MEIKQATVLDIPAIVKFCEGYFESTKLKEFSTYDSQGFSANLHTIIQSKAGKAFLLWDDVRLSGVIIGVIFPNIYNLSEIMGMVNIYHTASGEWDEGLVAHLEDWCKENGIKAVLYPVFNKVCMEHIAKRGKKIGVTFMRNLNNGSNG